MMTLRRTLTWFMPVAAFYMAFSAVLVLASLLISAMAIPADSYLLSLSDPFTIFVAPFAGPLSDSSSSAGTMLVLLLGFVLLLQLDADFATRQKYRTVLCVVPLIAGVVASAIYLVPMKITGLIHDGSGSSIIVAGLNGMLVITSFAVFNGAFRRKEYVDSAFSLVLLLTFVYAFRIAFLQSGNAPAHFYGFLMGIILASLYFVNSSRRLRGGLDAGSGRNALDSAVTTRSGLRFPRAHAFLDRLLGPAEKGSVSIKWTVISPIAPAEYRFIVERKIPTVTIHVDSSWKKPITDFEGSVRLQDVSDWVSQSRDTIAASENLEIVLPLPEEKLYGQEEKTVIFELKCRYKEPDGRQKDYADTKPARVLSKDDMIWSLQRGEETEDLSALIAAWVTPRQDEVQKLVHESSTNPNAAAVGGILGYQMTQHVSDMRQSVKVPPQKYNPQKLHLRRGAQVRGTLTRVAGGSGNDVNFWFLDSDSMVTFADKPAAFNGLRAQRVTSNYVFSFVAPVESDYYLVLDNTFSGMSGKEVDFSLHIITPITHEEIVMYQIKAIYETIQRKGFSYVNTPISYAPGTSQRVKRPSETIGFKGGNCIDATVLFASCFEATTLDTFVVLLPEIGHSLVSVRTWSDSDRFFTLETTVVGSATFEESLVAGERTLQGQKEKATWISVTECRKKRIMPLA